MAITVPDNYTLAISCYSRLWVIILLSVFWDFSISHTGTLRAQADRHQQGMGADDRVKGQGAASYHSADHRYPEYPVLYAAA